MQVVIITKVQSKKIFLNPISSKYHSKKVSLNKIIENKINAELIMKKI